MDIRNRLSTIQSLLLAAAACLFTGLAAAQGFPSKPITLVVPNPPGGFVDASARLLSDPLSRVLGQSVVVDNKGGGSGNVAYGQVARANPDGSFPVLPHTPHGRFGSQALA